MASNGDPFNATRVPYFRSSGIGTSPCSPSSLSGSTRSSSMESELGSTESESDMDGDYAYELTRQMALFMFLDDDDAATDELAQNFNDSLLPAPWACQDVDMATKLQNWVVDEEDKHKHRSRGSSESSSPLSPSSTRSNSRSSTSGPDSDFSSKQALIEDQIRNAKLAHRQSENQNGRRKRNGSQRKGHKQMELNKQIRQAQLEKKASTRFEQQTKEVFPGEPSSRNSSIGTGVFLPRGTVYDHEPSEKSGRPTVVIPARVVQALKLHFDKVGISSLPATAVSLIQNDGVVGDVIYGLDVGDESGKSSNASRSPEKLLPQEWTY